MLIFQYSNEKDWKHNSSLLLNIEVSNTNLTLLLWDEFKEKVVALEEFSLDNQTIESSLATSLIHLNSLPKKISCVISNTEFTLIPSAIFKEENKKEYLEFNTQLKQNYTVESSKLLKQEVFTCFQLDTKIQNILTQKYPTILFKPLENILIDSFKNGLSINFSSTKTLEIIYLKDEKLNFCNNFSFSNKDEMMYFISLVTEKLNLKLEKEKISLTGKINSGDENYKFLLEFIPEKNLRFNSTDEKTKHKYYTLFKQIECV